MTELRPKEREDLYRDLRIDHRYHMLREAQCENDAQLLNAASAVLASAAVVGFVGSLAGDTWAGAVVSAGVGLVGAAAAAINATTDPRKREAEHTAFKLAYGKLVRDVTQLEESDAEGLKRVQAAREAIDATEKEPYAATVIEAKNLLTRELRLHESQLVPITKWERFVGRWRRSTKLNVTQEQLPESMRADAAGDKPEPPRNEG